MRENGSLLAHLDVQKQASSENILLYYVTNNISGAKTNVCLV